jgi:hypothetical protein
MMPGPAAGAELRWGAVRRIALPGTLGVPPRRTRADTAEAEYLEDVGRPEDGPASARPAPPAPPAHHAA